MGCNQPSTCPEDPAPTQAGADECSAELAGGCAETFQALYDCYAARRVCAFGGTTDVLATGEACAEEESATLACGGDGGLPP